MPRKSSAALAIPAVDGQPPRLEPPAFLSPDEREIFLDLVRSTPRTHFRASDMPLLARYVEACALAGQAAHELRTHGALNEEGRPSGWIVIQEKAVRAMTALSLRLRLSPQGRISVRTINRQKVPTHPPPWLEGD